MSLELGLLLTFALTLVTAGYMSGQLSHHIGNGGAGQQGFPIMGWSRTGGNLRVAQFFATHAMHIMPAVGFVAIWMVPASAGRATVVGASFLYSAFVGLTLVEAVNGQPFKLLGF